jgi:hypothetical protein
MGFFGTLTTRYSVSLTHLDACRPAKPVFCEKYPRRDKKSALIPQDLQDVARASCPRGRCADFSQRARCPRNVPLIAHPMGETQRKTQNSQNEQVMRKLTFSTAGLRISLIIKPDL